MFDTNINITDAFPIYVAFISGLLACVSSLVLANKQSEYLTRLTRIAYNACVISLSYATIYLIQQILSDARYDIVYINNYSGPNDELIYKISSLWAGQEGSLLFWTLVIGLIGFLLMRIDKPASSFLKSFWCSILAFFLAILIVESPFERYADFRPEMIGSGLNPLLKNFWMAIHPPVIFIGYALLMVPAALALRSLIACNWDRWAEESLPWTLIGWAMLSAGLALGMVWAYEVLGWGGYWSWDPVENASLIPWIAATALLHGQILQKNAKRACTTNTLLAISTLILILLAAFLTRSGVFADFSVHSFGNSDGQFKWTTSGILFLVCIIFYSLAFLVLFIARIKHFPKIKSSIQLESKEFLISFGMLMLILFGIIVLAGSLYPFMSNIFRQSEEYNVLSTQFYNRMSAPIAAASLVLIALAIFAPWLGKNSSSTKKCREFIIVYRVIVICVLIAVASGLFARFAPNAAMKTFAWLTNTKDERIGLVVQILIMIVAASLIVSVASIYAMRKSAPIRWGANISHLGVALLVLGIVFSSNGRSTSLLLSDRGEFKSTLGLDFAYKGRNILKSGQESYVLIMKLGSRLYDASILGEYSERGSKIEPRVISFLTGDIYISPREFRSSSVTPTASVTSEGWVSIPVDIPGTKASLSLVGMNVENHAAKLRYQYANKKPVDIVLNKGKSVKVGDYTLTFDKWVLGESNMPSMTAGANIIVEGPGIVDGIVIEVSTKPLIGLVWAGVCLIFIGGIIAFIRRRAESNRFENGLLPDND